MNAVSVFLQREFEENVYIENTECTPKINDGHIFKLNKAVNELKYLDHLDEILKKFNMGNVFLFQNQ